jgi:hypothetical protein
MVKHQFFDEKHFMCCVLFLVFLLVLNKTVVVDAAKGKRQL